MPYLFLSFADNLDKDSKSKRDFYNLSLEKQYNILKKRIPAGRQLDSFTQFIEQCFPSAMQKKYYLSCPNFLREKRTNASGATFLNNLVIRPEKTLSMRSFLPDNQNIILIGDIYEGGKLKMFSVKGIQLIDDSMSSPYDLVISGCPACNSYSRNNWSINHVDYNDTYFTPDNILEIIERCYTVENPAEIRRTYDLWHEYFKFRDYYLKEQSNRNLKVDACYYLETFAVNRKEYKMDSMTYDEFILDEHDDFKRGDMIVVTKKVAQAESFPLVRVDFIRNKKAFLAATITKGKKTINEEERLIRSLANDNVIITTLDPKKEDKLGSLINAGYELGERFKTIKFEIEPLVHLEQVTKQCKKDIEDSIYSIELKYKNRVTQEVEEYLNSFENQRRSEIALSLDEYIAELEKKLNSDVEKNADKDILKLIDTEVAKIKKSLKQVKDESKKDFEKRLEEAIQAVDVKAYYIARNNALASAFEKRLLTDLEKELKTVKTDKERELTNKYKEDIRNESAEVKQKLEAELEQKKAQIIEDETEICFSVYFKPNERREVSSKQAELISTCEYIIYDYRAEKAKLQRQEMALENFYSGNVKNPYLSTYLFTPEKLQQVVAERTDWQWYLESLNDMQKEAVRKAVSSNGVFLLQGPPGTGKTQVIAETVAHLVKAGKKVLISSETHKAIDNVFERLPKIAEIVPIRLISSKNNKDSEYTPKYLVDNFYLNISTNMKNIVNKYKNFKKNKEDFEENFDQLKLLNSKIEKAQAAYLKAQKQIEELDKQAKIKNNSISELKDKVDSIRMVLDTLKRTRRHAEKFNLSLDEDIRQDVIAKFVNTLSESFDSSEFITTDIEALVKNINSIKTTDVENEVRNLNPESNEAILKAKQKTIKAALAELRDEDDEIIPGKEQEYANLRTQLVQVNNELKASGQQRTGDGLLDKIFVYDFMIKNTDVLASLIESKKNSLILLRNDLISEIDELIAVEENKQNDIQDQINSIGKEIKNINAQIDEIEDSSEVQEIQTNKSKLEIQIDTFFKEFGILEPYKDINDALNIIKETFEDLEINYAQREAENKEKIPMYEKISKYLSQIDVIEDDRRLYTKDLFESANVFGITCTSNDRFTNENNTELGDFNIDDIDIKSIGIDVVIIDEVSKSSFIDLLIPILYGKTVILVGDHRQLPPMYEFAKMRDEEFENLDENIINPDINKKFTTMYEECFFKTLFERIPNDYKTMLVQQYRCHEHIMKVFNHFYQGELRIGFNGQNNQKKHNIELYSNGRKIIQPDKHVYFVDCKQFETRDQDSTSIYNVGEARVVVELLKKLKLYFRNNPKVEPLSVGVICTYGDQAKKIKDLMKAEKITANDFKTGQEKLIVSTVDDFQGDERDIIILSTVRNPQEPGKSNPGFILAYQRINVALSRARKLLCVVGNRNYLEQRGVIDLPDVFGRPEYNQRNFRVYEEILNTIETYGKVVEDIDIIEAKEGKINA